MNSFSYNRRWVAPSKKDPLCPNFTSFNNINPISPSLYIATTSESIMIKKRGTFWQSCHRTSDTNTRAFLEVLRIYQSVS